jgi:hypothetical protein
VTGIIPHLGHLKVSSAHHSSFRHQRHRQTQPAPATARSYTYIHTYIHAYIHTYIQTYIHTCDIHTYIHTCIHSRMHTSRNGEMDSNPTTSTKGGHWRTPNKHVPELVNVNHDRFLTAHICLCASALSANVSRHARACNVHVIFFPRWS